MANERESQKLLFRLCSFHIHTLNKQFRARAENILKVILISMNVSFLIFDSAFSGHMDKGNFKIYFFFLRRHFNVFLRCSEKISKTAVTKTQNSALRFWLIQIDGCDLYFFLYFITCLLLIVACWLVAKPIINIITLWYPMHQRIKYPLTCMRKGEKNIPQVIFLSYIIMQTNFKIFLMMTSSCLKTLSHLPVITCHFFGIHLPLPSDDDVICEQLRTNYWMRESE